MRVWLMMCFAMVHFLVVGCLQTGRRSLGLHRCRGYEEGVISDLGLSRDVTRCHDVGDVGGDDGWIAVPDRSRGRVIGSGLPSWTLQSAWASRLQQRSNPLRGSIVVRPTDRLSLGAENL